MDFKKLNLIGGWATFLVAFIVYALTIEPTTSFWDCGEFIATSYKLLVGHPPGAPTFMLIGRVFSLFASVENVAMSINLLSALSSALTILFMFWSLSYLAKKFVKDEELKGANAIAVLGSAFIGSMAFTFSDTFWFSAVEGEVYAMSSFCTALVFWAILKWESVADEPHSTKWIIFIFFVIGLSIGVHLLNLLAIPAIVFVYYFKRYKPTRNGGIIAFLISIAILGFIQMILIPQVVNIASKFELLFTNGFGAPFHSGSVFLGLLVAGGLAFGLYYTQKRNQVLANTALLSFTVLLVGYTSFGMILVRSNADPTIDQNNPSNMVNLLSYLKREQYGDVPLVKGHFFDSPLDNREPYLDASPVYYPDKETGRYEIADDGKNGKPNYASEFDMLFPRMWSSKSGDPQAYKAWSDFQGKPIRYRTIQGENQTIYKPTFGENIKYFVKYQLYWMWGRYFMWNFAGRQNDKQGHGIDQNQFTHGNWLSGIKFLDEMRLGNMDHYPSELQGSRERAYNKYYLLPLLLGLIGLFFHYRFDKRNSLVVFLLFFFTGVAIVVYLNNDPYQPRERDYAFVGSYYAFAFWIGLAVMGIYREFRDRVNAKALASGVTGLSFVAAPLLMATQNWDDHDRSDRYTARELARNYLDSCAPNAILFTNGDNDTFPLWYLQEVEEYRTDVRVANLMLLNTDWYIEQMSRKAYDGEGIPISMTPDQYRQGTRDFIRYMEMPNINPDKHYNIKKIIPILTDDKYQQRLSNGSRENILPTKRFKLDVPKEKVLENGTVRPELADQIVDELRWKVSGRLIQKNTLTVLDILAHFNWDRPIYFSITMGTDAFQGLHPYFQQEGFAYRLVPIKTEAPQGRREYGIVNTDLMYERMVNQFEWGGFEDDRIWLDENNLRFVTNMRFAFVRLASALADEGDNERAERTLDRCIDVTMSEQTRYDGSLLPVIEEYYRIGSTEKANEIGRLVLNRELEYFEYFTNIGNDKLKIVNGNIRQSLGTLGQLAQLASRNLEDDDDFKKETESVYNNTMQQYQALGI